MEGKVYDVYIPAGMLPSTGTQSNTFCPFWFCTPAPKYNSCYARFAVRAAGKANWVNRLCRLREYYNSPIT